MLGRAICWFSLPYVDVLDIFWPTICDVFFISCSFLPVACIGIGRGVYSRLCTEIFVSLLSVFSCHVWRM
jgi:hypothetical protein